MNGPRMVNGFMVACVGAGLIGLACGALLPPALGLAVLLSVMWPWLHLVYWLSGPWNLFGERTDRYG